MQSSGTCVLVETVTTRLVLVVTKAGQSVRASGILPKPPLTEVNGCSDCLAEIGGEGGTDVTSKVKPLRKTDVTSKVSHSRKISAVLFHSNFTKVKPFGKQIL